MNVILNWIGLHLLWSKTKRACVLVFVRTLVLQVSACMRCSYVVFLCVHVRVHQDMHLFRVFWWEGLCTANLHDRDDVCSRIATHVSYISYGRCFGSLPRPSESGYIVYIVTHDWLYKAFPLPWSQATLLHHRACLYGGNGRNLNKGHNGKKYGMPKVNLTYIATDTKNV